MAQQNADLISIKSQILRILNNHKQASLQGLQMVIQPESDKILSCLSELIAEGKVKESKVTSDYKVVVVYKLNKVKQLKMKF
jgi:anion-transporting  ArsA/GET3 family ATPase